MEIGAGGLGSRAVAVPSPNAGKNVTVRLCKRYAEATNQVFVGEVMRETDNYLVMRGYVMSYRKGGEQTIQRDREAIRWIPWAQIAVVTEWPDVKWRETEFFIDATGQIQHR